MADEKGIRATLERVFGELTQVKVVTAVGTLEITLPEEDGRTKTKFNPDAAPITDAIVTVFDLVDGDVTNVIAPALKDDEALRSYHSQQVEKSLSVLSDNIKALVELGTAIKNEFGG